MLLQYTPYTLSCMQCIWKVLHVYDHHSISCDWMVDLPVTGKLHIGGLWLTLLSDQHFIQEPTTTSTPAIMTNSHPPEGAEWYSLYHKLICLKQTEQEKNRIVKGWNVFLSNIRNCIWYAFGILCVVAVLKMSVDLSWQRKKDRDKWQRSQMCGHKIKSVLFGSLPLMLAKFKLCMSLLLYAFS